MIRYLYDWISLHRKPNMDFVSKYVTHCGEQRRGMLNKLNTAAEPLRKSIWPWPRSDRRRHPLSATERLKDPRKQKKSQLYSPFTALGLGRSGVRVRWFQNFLESESCFGSNQKSWNRNRLHSGTGTSFGNGSSMNWKQHQRQNQHWK